MVFWLLLSMQTRQKPPRPPRANIGTRLSTKTIVLRFDKKKETTAVPETVPRFLWPIQARLC